MAGELFELNGDGDITADELAALKEACERWNRAAGTFYARRETHERARGCVWDGQNLDGRLWDDLTDETCCGIFSGALDMRLRWADRITLQKQATLTGALALARVSVEGSGPDGDKRAAAATTLLRWLVRRQGARWTRAWMRLANWYVGDTPAVAMMAVRWNGGSRLAYRTVTAEEYAGAWSAREIERAGDDPYLQAEALARVTAQMAAAGGEGPDAEAALLLGAGVLRQMTGAPARACMRAARELAAGAAEAEVLTKVRKPGGARVEALRFGDDFVVADNCRDFEEETVWFAPEWLSVAELRSRVASMGWDKDFVAAVEEQGETAVLANGPEGSDVTPAGNSGVNAKQDRRQVVWGYVRGIDAEGTEGRYVCVFGSGEKTAFGWRLLRSMEGRWPMALFQREAVGKYALGSRGVPEIAGPSQGCAKALWDMAGNNGLIGGLPPVEAKGYSVKNQTVSPLRIIGMNVNEEFKFMQPPAFPAAAQRVADKIEADLLDYFGMPREGADKQALAEMKRSEVGWWLAQAGDVLQMMLDLARDEADEETLASVTDERGAPAGIRRDDLAGSFGVTVTLNADDMDTEALVARITAVGQVLLAMDKGQTVDTTPIVEHGLLKLLPDVGPRALLGKELGRETEEREEAQNLVMIRAGVMPRMNTEGLWNYEARIGMYERMARENPAAFDDMSDDKRQMLADWIEALQQQAKQFGANREIGRTGVRGVGAE